MELSYKELAKREVINISDGRSLGRICDALFSFPKGVLTGIFVPARKNRGLLTIFDKSKLFIGVSQIVKIGGDVILVNITCGENCAPSVSIKQHANHCEPQNKKPCPPPCPPSCSPCPPKNSCSNNDTIDLSGIFNENGRIDLDDY